MTRILKSQSLGRGPVNGDVRRTGRIIALHPIASQLEKEYPPRGPLRQYRFKDATAFHCFRCGTSKKAKLITVYASDWNRRLCNGCYGRLLSIHEIKEGTAEDDEKADQLSQLLLSLFNRDQLQELQHLFLLNEKRASSLAPSTLKFLATSEHVAKSLTSDDDLDWSPAVIGLCKAVELEVVERLVTPLCGVAGLENDAKDKDIGRIAKFCKDANTKPPELGTFGHFLQTLINSESRRSTSCLMQAFMSRLQKLSHANWILDMNGLHAGLVTLTRDYRNRAAHIDDLQRTDYDTCRELVIGDNGLLWRLVQSTTPA